MKGYGSDGRQFARDRGYPELVPGSPFDMRNEELPVEPTVEVDGSTFRRSRRRKTRKTLLLRFRRRRGKRSVSRGKILWILGSPCRRFCFQFRIGRAGRRERKKGTPLPVSELEESATQQDPSDSRLVALPSSLADTPAPKCEDKPADTSTHPPEDVGLSGLMREFL
ncbi:hypothetical protein PM082_023561 [Marasmius tenuissimus]|nr:hypothetical protein PM082_023561 [Marasmius tenuissimus]